MDFQPFFNATIIGTGSAFPERILSNHELMKIVDTTEQWIIERTGIYERRISDLTSLDEQNSALGIRAALEALEMANIDASELNQIIYATCTSDTIIPSSACRVQQALKATKSIAFDINAACSGFLVALSLAHQAIAANHAKNCLVIGADLVSTLTNWQDRSSCILFGDGAAAVVVTQAPMIQNKQCQSGILGSYLRSDGSAWEMLHIPGGGSKMPITGKNYHEPIKTIHMKGQEVFKLAVNNMTEACRQILSQHNLSSQDVHWFIGHQANLRILEAIAKRLDMKNEKILINVDLFGNTSSATIPSVLNEGVRKGKIKKEDLILMCAFGGGANWGACLTRW